MQYKIPYIWDLLVLVIEDNLCNNYCNISLNSTHKDFLYKWTSSHNKKKRGENLEESNFKTKKLGHPQNPKPISFKPADCTPSFEKTKKKSHHPRKPSSFSFQPTKLLYTLFSLPPTSKPQQPHIFPTHFTSSRYLVGKSCKLWEYIHMVSCL